MSESSTSKRNTIDLRALQVVVEGPEKTNPPGSITCISCTLALFFEPTSNTAYLKLRLPLAPEDELYIYLFIDPKQIVSLSQEPLDNNGSQVAQLFKRSNRGTLLLRMTLSRPVTVIGPPAWPQCSTKVGAQTLEDLQFLATQTSLTLHIARDALPISQVQALCAAACNNGLLKSSPLHASYGRLYGGRGGKVIESIDEPAPPSYNDLAGASRPSQESAQAQSASSRKRRRESVHDDFTQSPTLESKSGVDAEAKDAMVEKSEHLREQMRSYIQALCNESMAEREANFRKEVFAEMENMESRIMSAMAEHAERIRHSVTDEIMHKLNEEVSLVVTRDEFEEVVDDKVAGIKIEMEDWCKDELQVVQDKILDHFENGVFLSRFRRAEDD